METTTTFIYNASDIETAQPVSVAELTAAARRKAARLTLPRIYRKELRLYRAIARWMERHPRLADAILYTEAAAGIYVIFMYA